VKEALKYYEKGGAYANILLNSVRANTRHIFNAWSESNRYVEDVDAAIARLKAGGYNFDPNTPDEHGYTDIGWYGLVTVGEGTVNSGTVKFPVRISGNNGLSSAIFTVSILTPVTSITDASGTKLEYDSSTDPATNMNLYTVSFKDPDVKIADRDLFYLVLNGNAPVIAADNKLIINYSDATDRIGHSTKLYIGERPVPSPAANQRQRMMQ